MGNKIKVLDCTLRDGGQGLEDMGINGMHTGSFEEGERIQIAEGLRDSGIDIIELGCMAESEEDKEGFAVYQDIRALSKYMPERKSKEQMYVGLYTGPDTDPGRIPEHSPGLVDGVRVILRYSELEKSLLYCRALAGKGYKVFMQPMLTMRYSEEELRRLADSANEMGAYALYFVDSYGYMENKDVDRLLRLYGEELEPDIYIGFHAHNNMGRALANAEFFLGHLDGRGKIIDSCAAGMGQGAGNLQTEVLVNYLNTYFGAHYDFNSVLAVCDILGKFRAHEMETWGYSPLRLIPAARKAAYKYAVAMKLQYGMSLPEIDRVLCGMPEEMRHRYTAENLRMMLKI